MCYQRRKKVVMLSHVNFLRNYSGFQYLADSLYERGFEVEIFAHVPHKIMPEAKTLPYSVHSCYEGFFGRIPRLRHLKFIRDIRRALSVTCDAVIINAYTPSSYYMEGVTFKRENPTIPLIQYSPELWLTSDQGGFGVRQHEYFLRHANIPEMIIDVEPNRARLRSECFGLKKTVQVIPNTLPAKSIPEPAAPGTLARIAGTLLPKDQRILVFTGVASPMMVAEMKTIMNAVSDRVFLLWFAHGSSQAINEARKALCSMPGIGRIHVAYAVSRKMLLSALHQADAGLIAYSYREGTTMNQRYAAPTKLYEYLAAGLSIVSYGNPSIKELVDKFNLGNCSKDDTPESLGESINELFDRADFASLREHVKEIFTERLCYEKSAGDVLRQICELIRTKGEVASSCITR